MRTFLYISIAVAVAGIVWAVWYAMQKPAAPLNASGYTYPGTPGA